MKANRLVASITQTAGMVACLPKSPGDTSAGGDRP